MSDVVIMYLKLNSSKEREYLCSKEGFFLLLDLDPRAKFNQQCKYKCPTTILPRYLRAEISE